MILSTDYYQVALQWHVIISGIHIWHVLSKWSCFLNYWPFILKIVPTHQAKGQQDPGPWLPEKLTKLSDFQYVPQVSDSNQENPRPGRKYSSREIQRPGSLIRFNICRPEIYITLSNVGCYSRKAHKSVETLDNQRMQVTIGGSRQ